MAGFDFTLFFDDCKEQFEDFDDFAEKCESVDRECYIDYDNQDATFYNYSLDFGASKRACFIKNTLAKSGKDYGEMRDHQYRTQQEFRNCMAMFF